MKKVFVFIGDDGSYFESTSAQAMVNIVSARKMSGGVYCSVDGLLADDDGLFFSDGHHVYQLDFSCPQTVRSAPSTVKDRSFLPVEVL